MLIGRILAAIDNAKQQALRISESRLPYTYHHDYMRSETILHRYDLSRSEIGCMSPNEEEAYAGALLYLIKVDPFSFILSGINGDLIRECLDINTGEIQHINTFLQVLSDMSHRKE